MVWTLIYYLAQALQVYVFLLFLYALLSWFPGGYTSTLGKILSRICEPYLQLFRKLPLQVGPMDFTIIAGVIGLEIISRLLIRLIQMRFQYG